MNSFTPADPVSPCSQFIIQPSPWGLTLDGPLGGEENMRRDMETFESQRNTQSFPAVRFYKWREPTVTYGRLQSRAGAEAFAAISGAKAVVQRPTGGGMVFHDTDLSFSIAWRRDHSTLPPCIKNVYRLFHEAIANELRSVGVEVSLHHVEKQRKSLPGACYQEFSQDDILWKGQKLVGGALRVTSWGRLYQGNLKVLPHLAANNGVETLINSLSTGVFLQPAFF
ncbi:MAG: hypothetical protein JNK54_07025 [Elusimicrobia bacterium]|jgi:lipoate-protein ligase A|nr:hypothetical protein [Elusimicrobiota bacterium]